MMGCISVLKLIMDALFSGIRASCLQALKNSAIANKMKPEKYVRVTMNCYIFVTNEPYDFEAKLKSGCFNKNLTYVSLASVLLQNLCCTFNEKLS